ncbi:bifunctional phosphopantothenoylcysteine decarboxylase/phosphopantothenate--cysteine ligase CoaBC [Corynebacterium renale]|uniref:bifunctional phosphopantothenoylcysteine decarboxylase/phosphopantothenate--cysteine ligase CoaBC n=1 Tax=Corynebacterium renale TaxID=1724 RepID=UPI000E04318E|nr:bifunctional phosphopantothenoylcysteine decarboxylase/phosphopantothenate--cysteine ligase CoaBC [Corynebacterium renale]STC96164.1 putative flavoprotein, involved CoA metabolism [Corynebacterium renale]
MNIVVGVAGGIAAYKACHLIRLFTEAGNTVKVVPTDSALNFVGAATFEALSGQPVDTGVFSKVDQVQHVRVGQDADGIVIAPATADLLARLVAGRADDLLAATVLVATCPVIIAPAMHTEMWNNPATVANVATLRSRGYIVLDPAHGRLTGKDSGAGRLPEPSQIYNLAQTVLSGRKWKRSLAGKKVLITAGGTREAIDPVRFIGNHSSGKQGWALAEIAAQMGASVDVVAGATETMPNPIGARIHRVDSTDAMLSAVKDLRGDADLIVMAAAVADFKPRTLSDSKMKKGSESEAGLTEIQLTENPDILRDTVQARDRGWLKDEAVIVGFAAETGDAQCIALEYARQKLQRKGCDYLMCNEVGSNKTFGADDNAGWLLHADGQETVINRGTKYSVAADILAIIAGAS